jgi:receptor expression-enhancing protein 5/6
LLTPYQQHVSNLDKELSKYPALNNFERQTSIPKVYVVLGLLALYFFLVFFNIAGEFLVNFAGFVIPGYYSLEALFSTSKTDDTQVSPLCHDQASDWRQYHQR